MSERHNASTDSLWDTVIKPEPQLAPARAAVVAVADRDQRTLLVAATGDARAFLAKRADAMRLGTHAESIALAFVGSALEADLLCLRVARAAVPDQHRAMVDRLRAWFVRFEPADDPPTWSKTNLADAIGQHAHRFVGPFAEKHAAGRFAEMLDELFDLCRYPRELAKAPGGTACAYKEMGKCPAACDGSEPMSAYTARVRRAITLSAAPIEHATEELDDQMRLYAADRDFEQAERLKKRIDLLAKSKKPTSKHRSTLDAFARLIVAPSPRRNWARLFRCDALGVRPLCDIPGKLTNAAADLFEDLDEAGDVAVSPPAAEELGVACAHLYAPAKKRVSFIDVGPFADHSDRPRAIARAVRAATSQPEPDDITERVLETG